jgi:hypothetical protein
MFPRWASLKRTRERCGNDRPERGGDTVRLRRAGAAGEGNNRLGRTVKTARAARFTGKYAAPAERYFTPKESGASLRLTPFLRALDNKPTVCDNNYKSSEVKELDVKKQYCPLFRLAAFVVLVAFTAVSCYIPTSPDPVP